MAISWQEANSTNQLGIVFNFFLLVFSLKASLELLLCGESSEGAESTPGTQLSSGSSISGAIGR